MADEIFGQNGTNENHNYLVVNDDGSINVISTQGAGSTADVVPYHADGTEGVLITGVEKVAGKDGIDSSTNSLQIVDYAHHEIHSGATYRVQAFNDAIPNGGTLVIAFYVPDQTKHPHIIWEFVHEGDVTVTLLEGPTITAGTGTDRLCRNSRRDSGDNSILQGTATGALVSNYVTIDPTYTGGTTVSLKRSYGARNVGGEGGRRAEVVLSPATYYAFELTNNTTQAQGAQIRLEWYEHADKN